MPGHPPESVVTVGASRRGHDTVIRELGGVEPWHPRVLRPAGAVARVALVQSRASLVAGDEVALEVELEGGCAVELVELGATLAHHARGGRPARVRASLRLGPNARLIWLGEPLIAAAGCSVERSTQIELAHGAQVLLGEALVLGRAAEEPGRARTRTRITLEGRPVVEETLDTEPAWLLRSSAVAGTAAMVAALTLAGRRDPDAPPAALQAHEPATLWRGVGPAAMGPAAAGLARRWAALVTSGRAPM
jgi:urease accessory protein